MENMTIHNFCKEVFEGNYFMMGVRIDDEMVNIIRGEYGLDWADARDRQLEILNDMEIPIIDEEEFLAGEMSIRFDYDSVSAVEDWAEDLGHSLPLGVDEWEQYDMDVNDVLKSLLIKNSLITFDEWNEIEDEFYAFIMDGDETEVTKREIGELNLDLSETYFENYQLEEILSSVIAGCIYSE